jgi:hypothetical protein
MTTDADLRAEIIVLRQQLTHSEEVSRILCTAVQIACESLVEARKDLRAIEAEEAEETAAAGRALGFDPRPVKP